MPLQDSSHNVINTIIYTRTNIMQGYCMCNWSNGQIPSYRITIDLQYSFIFCFHLVTSYISFCSPCSLSWYTWIRYFWISVPQSSFGRPRLRFFLSINRSASSLNNNFLTGFEDSNLAIFHKKPIVIPITSCSKGKTRDVASPLRWMHDLKTMVECLLLDEDFCNETHLICFFEISLAILFASHKAI